MVIHGIGSVRIAADCVEAAISESISDRVTSFSYNSSPNFRALLFLGSRSELGPTRRLFAQGEKLPIERLLLLEWNAAYDAEQFAAFGNVGLHQLRGLQQGVTFGFGQRRIFWQLCEGLDDRQALAMLLVKSVDLGIAEDATQGRIEELLLKSDVCASLPIEALATGLRRQTVACPEMFGDLV